jgi:SAM-dependent methyltransferase
MDRNWDIKRVIEEKKIPADEKKLYDEKLREEDGYIDFYAKRQDKIIEKDPQAFEKVNRVYQIDYLKGHGLDPGESFLDYGCGPAAAGVYFIEYLKPGKYVGVDISKTSIDVGLDLIERRGLAVKKPRLFHILTGTLECLGDETYDILWAQSVFTHLPPEQIIKIMQRLKPHMHAHSRFYATFSRVEKGIVQQQLHNWYYDLAFFHDAARHRMSAIARESRRGTSKKSFTIRARRHTRN